MTAEQLDVFGGSVPLASAPSPRSRLDDPDTSVQAGAGVDLNKRCREVLRYIHMGYRHQPFTDGSLADFIEDDRNIVARRRKDLTDAHLVEPVMVGKDQAQRMGRRGRMEYVWQITERGRQVAATLTQEVP